MTGSRRFVSILAVAAFALASTACRKTALQGRIQMPGSDVANVAVRIVPEADVKAFLDDKAPKAMVELEERQKAFEAASRAEDARIREHQQAFADATGASTTRDGVQVSTNGDGTGIVSYDPTQHTAAEARAIGQNALPDLDSTRVAAATSYAAQKPAFEQATQASRDTKEGAREYLLAWETDMLADMPEKGEVVYTDADGRFTAKLPRGRVAIVANGDFKIGGTLQHRGWGLWLNLDASEKTLVLEANNLLLHNPRESVLR